MKVNNVLVVSLATSKKGALMASICRAPDKLVDNCFVSNPLNLIVEVDDVVSGEMIFNNDGFNTFVLTEVNT